jgi:superfamily II DNA/RNA helicase
MMKDVYGSMLPGSYKMSSKTEAVIEHVEDIIAGGDKVILFTKFRTCAQMIADDIYRQLNVPVVLYTGAENEEARIANIDRFRNTQTTNVLVGTEAMAEGLNLSEARYVINIDQPDTLAIKTQRIGRIRRVSSTFNTAIVYDMITLSDGKITSKDEERLKNIEDNGNVTDALVSIDEAQRQALVAAMKTG